MEVTLGNASKQLGVSKPTISKAIAKGQLSARRRDDGSFAIDTSELARWWENVRHRFQPGTVSHLQVATTPSGSENAPLPIVSDGNAGDSALQIQLAKLETELAGVRELLKVHREQIDDLRSERDKLLNQVDTAHRLLTHHQTTLTAEPTKKGWWPFRRAG